MDTSFYAGGIIGLALLAANLPFFVGHSKGKKSIGLLLRLVMLVVAYGVVGTIGFGLESYLGKTTGQGWEFYAITFAMFVTFAFPGFVYCYLLRRP